MWIGKKWVRNSSICCSVGVNPGYYDRAFFRVASKIFFLWRISNSILNKDLYETLYDFITDELNEGKNDSEYTLYLNNCLKELDETQK